MKNLPSTDKLQALGPTLHEVTESLKRRNDSLQLYLTKSGWIIRKTNTQKPKPKPE